jgi:hypothetical protein
MKLKEKENKHQLFTIYENARKTNSNIFWGGFSNEQETKSQHASCLPFMKMPGKKRIINHCSQCMSKQNPQRSCSTTDSCVISFIQHRIVSSFRIHIMLVLWNHLYVTPL